MTKKTMKYQKPPPEESIPQKAKPFKEPDTRMSLYI